MQLEMPYLMNVLLYIQNEQIPLIPLISKKSQDACKAMRINPWMNWSKTPINDIEMILKTFPRLETFRVDYLTLKILSKHSIFETVEMIEIVNPMVGYSVDYFSSEIKDKLTTSFSGMTGNKTKNVILAYPSKNNIRQFINNNQLKFIRLEFSTTPNDGIIQEINNINKSVRVCVSIHSTSPATITNLNKSLGSNISIINTIKSVGLITNYHEDVDMCVNPFESENSIKTYEKYYLPTKLIFQKFQDNSYDFKEFEFVKDITFEENTVMHDMEIRLPISTQTINFKYRYEFNTLWKITNWNELINIKEINDFGNIDIPYPQIKYEHDQSTITRANLLERMCGYASLLCCLYLFVPTLTMIFSVIFHPFNFEYLSNSIRNQINIFYIYHQPFG